MAARWGALLVGFAAGQPSRSIDSFTVAQVKPHFGCKGDGQERVRQYIRNLATAGTGIIALLETEFEVPRPAGYLGLGASCGHHADPAVALVDGRQFSLVSTIGHTVAGNYSALPYVGGAQAPSAAANSMCVSDPDETFGPGGLVKTGSRPYAGAVLLHRPSGKEFCVIVATFAHCLRRWTPKFMSDVESGCGQRQMVIVADTNAGCVVPGMQSSSLWSMNELFVNNSKASWGPCHDPGIHKDPTCCNDFLQGAPYARFWYDRTAVCRGGSVQDFRVQSAFVCGNSSEEHLFTTATVHLAQKGDVDSPHCLDHSACAHVAAIVNDTAGDRALPLDGLCCPTSMTRSRLACCTKLEVAARVLYQF